MKVGDTGMEQCYYCGEAKGVLLATRDKAGVEVPRLACFNKEPCERCREYMDAGIMLSVVKDGEYGKDEPYRLGMIAVITEDAAKRMFPHIDTKKHRFVFIEETPASKLGIIDEIKRLEREKNE